MGVAGPMLIGFPPPPHLETHGMSNVDLSNATCNVWNCIPDELVLNKKGTNDKAGARQVEIHMEHLWLGDTVGVMQYA